MSKTDTKELSPAERSHQRLAEAQERYNEIHKAYAKIKQLAQSGVGNYGPEKLREIALARVQEDLFYQADHAAALSLRTAKESLRTDHADLAEAVLPFLRQVQPRFECSASIEPAPTNTTHQDLDVPYLMVHQVKPSKRSPSGDGEVQGEVTICFHRDRQIHAELDMEKLAGQLRTAGVRVHPDHSGGSGYITLSVGIAPEAEEPSDG